MCSRKAAEERFGGPNCILKLMRLFWYLFFLVVFCLFHFFSVGLPPTLTTVTRRIPPREFRCSEPVLVGSGPGFPGRAESRAEDGPVWFHGDM